MVKQPKWSNPERQAYLIELFQRYGNMCLYGHPVCRNPAHYIKDYPELVELGKSVKVIVLDKNGLPVKDSAGNQLYINKVIPVKGVIHHYKDVHLYDIMADDIIHHWKEQDREQHQAEFKATLRAIHSLGEHTFPLHGRFSAVSREIWADKQPLYYIQSLGINGLTYKPFAKVKMPSNYFVLYVDLGDSLKPISKCKRRKAIRYGKPLPKKYEQIVSRIVNTAVSDYLS